MSALTITAASVLWSSGSNPTGDQIAGEAFAAGAAVYLKASDGKWYKAQCDGTAEEAGSEELGIALATADAAGARVSIAKTGCVVSIGTGTAGIVYCPGRTAGSWVPTADLLSTDKVTVGAVCIGSSKLLVHRIYNAGAVI